MPNEQALSKIETNMRIIDQNQKALTWLEDYRADFDKAVPSQAEADDIWSRRAFKLNESTPGSALTGFKEASFLINEHLKAETLNIIDTAIAAARFNIRNATEEIKHWSARL